MKYSIRSIAKMLNAFPSTISREINRNKKETRANTYGIYVNCKHRKNCNLLINSTAKQCSTSCPNCELEFNKKNSFPVCNTCPKNDRCRLIKKAYKTNVAGFRCEDRISSSKFTSK